MVAAAQPAQSIQCRSGIKSSSASSAAPIQIRQRMAFRHREVLYLDALWRYLLAGHKGTSASIEAQSVIPAFNLVR